MRRMKSWNHVNLTLLVVAGLAVACGSSGGPEPTAYVSSTLGASPDPAPGQTCNINAVDSPFFTISSAGGAGIPSGGEYNGTPVTVTCYVDQDGTSFTVSLQAQLGNANDLTITGTATNTQSPQTGFIAEFSELNVGYYNESNCTLTLASEAQANGEPIKQGAIMGSITCPSIVDTEHNAYCAASATFVFTNCG